MEKVEFIKDMAGEENRKKRILFLDSGIGGISILSEVLKILPNENYVFFGDTKNAPYGDKTAEALLEITFENIKWLLEEYSIKAIVIACNTITGVAVDKLREEYKDIEIIGVEPAVKPAVENTKKGDIWLLATERTLKEEKLDNLIDKYGSSREIEKIPCPGLMEYPEKGVFEGRELEEFLIELFGEKLKKKPVALVLGCTHYPFVTKGLKNVFDEDISIYHGAEGTAKRLKSLLEEKKLLNYEANVRDYCDYNIEFVSSGDVSIMEKLARKLLKLEK